ncbi:MAG: hypothetical protein NZ701_17090 [Roseiflexus sp.]|nr:hypothetical protein [Roseiflexus sp.]
MRLKRFGQTGVQQAQTVRVEGQQIPPELLRWNLPGGTVRFSDPMSNQHQDRTRERKIEMPGLSVARDCPLG